MGTASTGLWFMKTQIFMYTVSPESDSHAHMGTVELQVGEAEFPYCGDNRS